MSYSLAPKKKKTEMPKIRPINVGYITNAGMPDNTERKTYHRVEPLSKQTEKFDKYDIDESVDTGHHLFDPWIRGFIYKNLQNNDFRKEVKMRILGSDYGSGFVAGDIHSGDVFDGKSIKEIKEETRKDKIRAMLGIGEKLTIDFETSGINRVWESEFHDHYGREILDIKHSQSDYERKQRTMKETIKNIQVKISDSIGVDPSMLFGTHDHAADAVAYSNAKPITSDQLDDLRQSMTAMVEDVEKKKSKTLKEKKRKEEKMPEPTGIPLYEFEDQAVKDAYRKMMERG